MSWHSCIIVLMLSLALLLLPVNGETKEIFFGEKKGQQVADTEDRERSRHEELMEVLKGVEKEMDRMGQAAQEQANKMEEQNKTRAQMLKTQEDIRALLEQILAQLKENAAREEESEKGVMLHSDEDDSSRYRYLNQPPH